MWHVQWKDCVYSARLRGVLCTCHVGQVGWQYWVFCILADFLSTYSDYQERCDEVSNCNYGFVCCSLCQFYYQFYLVYFDALLSVYMFILLSEINPLMYLVLVIFLALLCLIFKRMTPLFFWLVFACFFHCALLS